MVLEGPFCGVEVFEASGVESVVIVAWGWAFVGVEGGWGVPVLE